MIELPIKFRGLPVRCLTEDDHRTLKGLSDEQLQDFLDSFHDEAKPGEPEGYVFAARFGGRRVWLQRTDTGEPGDGFFRVVFSTAAAEE